MSETGQGPGDTGAVTDGVADELDQIRVRREKIARLRAAGTDPYPPDVVVSHPLADISEQWAHLVDDEDSGDRVQVAGRVMLSRIGGRLCFATIRDGSGDLQVMLSEARLGEQRLADWKADVDLGDHVAIDGTVVRSRRGELSVMADNWRITSKALRPLPDKHHGLTDPQVRFRRRYLDLLVNPQARSLLETRSNAIAAVRSELHGRGFLEVETPILQVLHGGAAARPFITHINAFDMPVYLRIALELYLKRLVVGGIDRVFEIGRNFRNEGVDQTHNPEFTMLETYQAYADYDTKATLTRELIQAAATAAFGSTTVTHIDGSEHDLGGVWRSVTVYEAISHALGDEVSADTDEAQLRSLCDAAGIPHEPGWLRGQVVLEMYERLVESRTVEPTFYRDFPTDVSPLTRAHRVDPRVAERWDLVAFGHEVATAYTELVDPAEQRLRLVEQSLRAAGGDPEAMALDEDFIRALEHGMPPTGGMGMGMERMLMTLTGAPIRELLAFPLMRPEGG